MVQLLWVKCRQVPNPSLPLSLDQLELFHDRKREFEADSLDEPPFLGRTRNR